MSNTFPETPTYTGFNAPRRIEGEVFDLEVDGELPARLNGSFYRCGPDPRFAPRLGDDININGDGMVTLFRIKDGHVDFRSRYVRTEKFRLETMARKSLFGAYRNPYTDDPGVAGRDRTTANTNAVFHAGRLFALKEDGLPHELDPDTLETRGRHDYAGKMKSETATAHPKFDPQSGEMLSHGYEARGLASRDVALQVIARDGKLVREDFFIAPYCSMMHDWAVSAGHFIFPLWSTTADEARMRQGGPHWVFEADRDLAIGIMRRDADVKDIRWYRLPPGGVGHILNAFDDGDRVCVDLFISARNQFPFIQNSDGAPFDRERATPRLTRWTFDLSKKNDRFEARTCFSDFMEMPATDPRYQLHAYRHGFTAIVDPSRPLNAAGTIGVGWNTIAHVDLSTGRLERYYAGEKTTCGEPCFIPRSPFAPEGDGYLLSVLIRGDVDSHSELIVLDAQHIADGPMATVRLPFRIRAAVHGSWVPAAQPHPSFRTEPGAAG
ncbi:MAG: carotenoid oxygenase family protein [Gammaproteobacteria bacterium]|nr:carotenoid oxygenase family protein [Gammaproteobacteria bacterium]